MARLKESAGVLDAGVVKRWRTLLAEVDGFNTEELRRLPQLFLDAQQLVVLRNTVRARS
jgi:hypothetical protein